MWGPSAPIAPSSADGFELNSSIAQLISQNFKMLLMTDPGERVMYPEFGVGLRRYLFEFPIQQTYSQIRERIATQTAAYLPPIQIMSIEFNDSKMDQYQLGIRIEYKVTSMGIADVLDLLIK